MEELDDGQEEVIELMVEEGTTNDACEYSQDIAAESRELLKAMNVDQWVAVMYGKEWFPGIVQNVKKNFIILFTTYCIIST